MPEPIRFFAFILVGNFVAVAEFLICKLTCFGNVVCTLTHMVGDINTNTGYRYRHPGLDSSKVS